MPRRSYRTQEEQLAANRLSKQQSRARSRPIKEEDHATATAEAGQRAPLPPHPVRETTRCPPPPPASPPSSRRPPLPKDDPDRSGPKTPSPTKASHEPRPAGRHRASVVTPPPFASTQKLISVTVPVLPLSSGAKASPTPAPPDLVTTPTTLRRTRRTAHAPKVPVPQTPITPLRQLQLASSSPETESGSSCSAGTSPRAVTALAPASSRRPAPPQSSFATAEAIVQASWSCYCPGGDGCASSLPRPASTSPTSHQGLSGPGLTLAGMAAWWTSSLPPDLRQTPQAPCPLHQEHILKRDETEQKCQSVDWGSLLAGGDNPPTLNFGKSEAQYLRQDGNTIRLQRFWDIDSLIMGTSSLAIHKDGFSFALRPPYLQRITQNHRIRIRDVTLHKSKQLRLGHGVGDCGIQASTYIFFPHLPVSSRGETHLTLAEQAVWVDHIIFPALKATVGHNVRQHWPPSFEVADREARVKEEATIRGAQQPMDVRYPLPGDRLDAFWSAVVAGIPPASPYRAPLLVVIAHNLKIHTRRDTPAKMWHDFNRRMHQIYEMGPNLYFQPTSTWVDVGVEDVPHQDGITLLRKPSCLQRWAHLFQDPSQQKRHLTTTFYPFMLTRDAGSISVAVNESGPLHQLLPYHKAYNINKEVHSSPKKNHSAFASRYFEALALTQDLLDRCEGFARKGQDAGTAAPSQLSKATIIRNWERAKQRIAAELRDSSASRASYGIRSECRTSWSLAEQSTWPSEPHWTPISGEASPPPDHTPSSGAEAEQSHRAFWVLSTVEVNRFCSAALNRWILCLEACAARAHPGLRQHPVLPDAQLLLSSITVSACRRILELMIGSLAPSQRPELMKARLESRQHRRTRLTGLAPTAESEDGSAPSGGEDPSADPPHDSIGLDLHEIIQRTGTAWFPPTLFTWEMLPLVLPALAPKMRLIVNSYYDSFPGCRDIPAMVTRQNRSHTAFRLRCAQVATAAAGDGIRSSGRGHGAGCSSPWQQLCQLAAEWVVKSYTRRAFAVLATRAAESEGFPDSSKAAQVQLLAPLTTAESRGYCGLHHDMVERMMGCPPRVTVTRKPRHGSKKVPQFAPYQSQQWLDRIRGIVLWDDLGSQRRRWHEEPYRTLFVYLHATVLQEIGPDYAADFLCQVPRHMARRLLIIFQYDLEHHSVLYKPSPYHKATTRQEITRLSPLQKTNWYLPAYSPSGPVQRTPRGSQDLSGPNVIAAAVTPRLPLPASLRRQITSDALITTTGDTEDPFRLRSPASVGYQTLADYLPDFEAALDVESGDESE